MDGPSLGNAIAAGIVAMLVIAFLVGASLVGLAWLIFG